MHRSRGTAAAPAVITSAAISLDDQHDLRRRKYLVMMGLRVVCVIAAVVTASVSLWLSLAFIAAGAVLPWCAVLIANDRPAQRSTAFVRYRPPTGDEAGPRPLTAPQRGAGDAQAQQDYVVDAEPPPTRGPRTEDER